ncbi:MAG: Mur ligase domain-containing protein, partial [Pseudomonadota bacterium]
MITNPEKQSDQNITEALNLSVVAENLSGELYTNDHDKKIDETQKLNFTSLSIDSRKIQRGDLYVAIHGERFDGHDFVKEAMDKGAIACVVDHKLDETQLVQVIVKDCKQALGKIASMWREKYPIPVIAIT